MSRIFANNATTVLGDTLASTDTSVTVQPGTGGVFPVIAAPDFMDLTLEDVNGVIEIIRVTERLAGSDVLTIGQRGVEGTTPADFNADTRIELRLTAAALNGWLQEGEILSGGTF